MYTYINIYVYICIHVYLYICFRSKQVRANGRSATWWPSAKDRTITCACPSAARGQHLTDYF